MSELRGGTTIAGHLAWHRGNMGPGSGLNADTVDGMHKDELLDWNNITNKPTIFPPATHNHDSSYVPLSRLVSSGTGLTGGGSLGSDQTLSLDLTYTDNRYLGKTAQAIDADKVDGLHAASFMRADADDTFSGKHIASARRAGIYGTYDVLKIDHIWSVGTSYMIDTNGANFGNLYGMAYVPSGKTGTGINMSGHKMAWVTNGTANTAIGENGLWTSGNIEANNTELMGSLIVNGTVSFYDNVDYQGNALYHTGNLEEIEKSVYEHDSVASAIDANGIYTVVEYRRQNNTLYMKSTLSSPDAQGNYLVDTWQFYNSAGTTVVKTSIWDMTYDSYGNIVTKNKR